MDDETIKIIRYALSFLRDVNLSIVMHSHNDNRIQQARLDLKKDNDAIASFEAFLKKCNLSF